MAQTEIRLSEIEGHMRQIAREVTAEQADLLRKEIMEGELGKLRLELDVHLRHIWEVINALTEAQRRTEERVNELAEAQRCTEERLERLGATVQSLAEAQRRTEERVNELAEAQRRTEERVNELAEAQRRTEERLERLEATVQSLAEAQRRTEERVNELAEAQRRTEERLERLEATVQSLAEAQRRTEERLERLEATVQSLVEAQRRTEETVCQLVEAQKRMEESLARLDRQLAETNKQVGQLANRLGLDLEVDAEEILRETLKKKGWELLKEPFPIVVDGEADVVASVRSPEGETFWVLVEVKGRVRRSEVGDWLRRLSRPDFQERLREVQVDKPYLPYIFGLRIYQGVEELAAEAGLGVLDYRGERLAPHPWK